PYARGKPRRPLPQRFPAGRPRPAKAHIRHAQGNRGAGRRHPCRGAGCRLASRGESRMTQIVPLSPLVVEPLVRMALAEDLGRGGDITTDSTVPAEARATVVIAAREEGRIAGMDLAEAAFRLVDPALRVTWLRPE